MELFMLYPTEEFCRRESKSSRLSLRSYRVIDRNGKWMKHWDDVPVTLSSLIPGWYLEALIRRNPDLTIYDIRVRFMDSFLFYDQKTKKMVTRSAWGNTAVTNRMMRFRDETFNLTCRYPLCQDSATSPTRTLLVYFAASPLTQYSTRLSN